MSEKLSNQELRELILDVADDLKRFMLDTLSEEIIKEHNFDYIEGFNDALQRCKRCVISYAYDYYPLKKDNN